jgi:DNA-directed RNA polymerase
MENFLKRAPAYTVLPTPEPDQALQATAIGGLFFTDTETQDRLAVVDACLHNLQDVPRAKQVFDGLRATPASAQLLTSRLYNQLLVSYVRMAEERQPEHRSLWVEEVWRLFDAMLAGTENCRPDAGSFAIMLLAWLKCVSRCLLVVSIVYSRASAGSTRALRRRCRT